MKHALFIAIVFACASLVGCASSRVSTAPVSGRITLPVKAIALAPGGGRLADLVGMELSKNGFSVIDSVGTSKLMGRLNLSNFEIARPEGLAKLKDQGIDALLTIHSVVGYDQQPDSASARANSTHTGQVIALITWQNGRGGHPESLANQIMRRGTAEAAADIANALVQNIRPTSALSATPR